MRSFPHFIKGTLLLTCAGLLCRFSGFFYKIFLAHALGAEGIGIYQLIFPVFAVCHACTASGIESAISRFTAGAVEKERSYALKAGLFLSLSASVLVCVLLWNRAEFVADKLLCESRCVTPLRILAPVIPLSAIHGCLQGYYLGQKKASLPAISQILEQAARIGSVILLYRIFIQESRAITPLTGSTGASLRRGCFRPVHAPLYRFRKAFYSATIYTAYSMPEDSFHGVASHRQPFKSDTPSKCGGSADSCKPPDIRSVYIRILESLWHPDRHVPVLPDVSKRSDFFSVCHAAPDHLRRAIPRQ